MATPEKGRMRFARPKNRFSGQANFFGKNGVYPGMNHSIVLTAKGLWKSFGQGEAKVDVIRSAFVRLGIEEAEKAETVMVGDRKYDVEGAAECGIPCIGVEFFDFAPTGELESAGALAVCRTAKELEQYLLEG